MCNTAWNGSYGTNCKGPITALDYLKTNTSDWKTSVQGDYSTYTANTSNASYSIDYSGYTSRLITAQEIAYIKGASWTESSSTSSIISSLPSELYENFTSTKGLYGYWSSSPSADNTYYAWIVRNSGHLDNNSAYNITGGVRPVINVSTSLVF